jgi:hypothetical protein
MANDNDHHYYQEQSFEDEKIVYFPVTPREPQEKEPQALRYRSQERRRNRNPQYPPQAQSHSQGATATRRDQQFNPAQLPQNANSPQGAEDEEEHPGSYEPITASTTSFDRPQSEREVATFAQRRSQPLQLRQPQSYMQPQVQYEEDAPAMLAQPPRWLRNVGEWGDVIIGSPIRWLFAGSPSALAQRGVDAQEADPLPGWLWMLLLFCGVVGFFWDVVLSQAAVTHIFPALSDPGKERILASGLIISVKSSLAGGIVSLFSSVAQYLFLRKLRQTKSLGRLQFIILLVSMAQNWVFNVVGYADLFHHETYLEWNPLASLWWPARGSVAHFEWGSVVIMIFAIVTAAMPEFCWSELTRPRRPGTERLVQTPYGLKRQTKADRNGKGWR